MELTPDQLIDWIEAWHSLYKDHFIPIVEEVNGPIAKVLSKDNEKAKEELVAFLKNMKFGRVVKK